MKHDEPFEHRLQRQPLRPVPSAWRAEILSAAERAAGSSHVSRLTPHASCWRELFWPHPQAWAALAVVWVVILAVNLTAAGDVPAVQARHAESPSRELREMLRQQRQMLAELGGATEKLEGRQARPVTPQPRSQRHEEFQNT